MGKRRGLMLVIGLVVVLGWSCFELYSVRNVSKGANTASIADAESKTEKEKEKRVEKRTERKTEETEKAKKTKKNSISTELPELKIGSAIFAPYFYIGEDGKETGIDVDIAKEACRRMGYEPVFKRLIWGNHDKLLDSGAVDCVWCSFSMNGRKDRYTWAGPYMYSKVSVVVAADSDIRSIEDLKGRSVATEVDSRAEDFFLKKSSVDVETVSTYSGLEDAFTAFGKGYVDAVADHEEALRNYTQKNKDLYRYLETPIFISRLGVAFKKGKNVEIAKKLTDTLNEMNEDGTTASIVKKYGLSENSLLEVSVDGKE